MTGSPLARARELRREGGLRRVATGALAVTVYRRLLLLECGTEPVDVANPLGLEIADVVDPREYEALRPGQRDAAARRLAAGARCFGSYLDGRLVAARWRTTGTPQIEYLGMTLPLGPDEVYIFDSFTDAAFRGRGIATTSQFLLRPVLAAEGFRRSVRAVLPENAAALREASKAGYELTGKIGWAGVGRLRHEFVRRHSSRSTA